MMKFKNLSLTLLATVAFGAGISSDVSAAAVAPVAAPAAPVAAVTLDSKLLKRSADEAHEVAAIGAKATSALDDRLAAARAKFDALSAVVKEKTEEGKQASIALGNMLDAARKQVITVQDVEKSLTQARSDLESDEAYFLVTQLNNADRAALTKLKAAQNIDKMQGNIKKSADELLAKQAELEQLQAEILAAVDAMNVEYTPSQAEVKGIELSSQQAALAAAQAQQAKLTSEGATLEANIKSSDAALTKLSQQIDLTKKLGAAGKPKLAPLQADFKAKTIEKSGHAQALAASQQQLGLVTAQIQHLTDAIAALQADIATIPAAAPGADVTAGESPVEKAARIAPLNARITKLKATQDPKGKLQTALAAMQASAAALDTQDAAKKEELANFKAKIVAERAAGKAPTATPAA
jgi:chromosome segregation ATPase